MTTTMSAMAMAQAGLCPGTPVLDERFDFLDEIKSAGEDEAWFNSIYEWAASSGPGTKLPWRFRSRRMIIAKAQSICMVYYILNNMYIIF